jgi:uncharacterized protein (TIGR00251 family)
VAAPFRPHTDGVLLRVRLTPRANKDGIDGIKDASEGAYLQARVRAVPEDGKANVALIELLAKAIGVPKSSLSITAGAASRLKTVLIAGDRTALEKRLAAWLESLK